ncbi:hypothetical protein APHAL10511_003029 [Amanita phalloides]|nr:hypothetical protein APHAL10511_003029 [Amanita phalloides]
MPTTYPLGALQVAGNVNSFLFGLTFMQCYKYFCDFVDDAMLLKVVVFSALLLSVIHTGCLEWAVYVVNVIDNREQLLDLPLPRPFTISVIAGQAAQCLVQLLWVYRIYRLQQSITLPIVLILPVIYVFGTGVAAAGMIWDQTINQALSWQQSRKWLILSQLIAIAAIDIIIAVMLCYHLRKNRSHYLSRTIEYIDTFICKWTFQTGAITSVTAFAVALAFAIRKQDVVWFAMYSCLMNLYPLTCVALLNGRPSSSHTMGTRDVLSSVQMDIIGSSAYGTVTSVRTSQPKHAPISDKQTVHTEDSSTAASSSDWRSDIKASWQDESLHI